MTRVTRFALLAVLAVFPLLTSSVAAQAPAEIDAAVHGEAREIGRERRTARLPLPGRPPHRGW